MKTRTPWFSHDEQPMRVGAYERAYEWGIEFAWFDGEDWGLSETTAQGAQECALGNPLLRSDARVNWRGLTEEVK